MHPLARLNPYLWKYKHLLIPGLLCAVVSAGFSIAVPIVVRQAVDSIPRLVALYQLHRGTDLQGYMYAQAFYSLVLFGIAIIALSLISGFFMFLMRQTVVVASRHIEFDLRNLMYEHVQKLSSRFFHQFSTGDVITRATSDIEHVRRYVGPALMYAARAVVIVVAALVVMLIISPRLTLFVLIPMPLLAIAIFFVAGLVHSRSDAIQTQYSAVTSRVQEALSGIRVLKAYTREDFEAEHFDIESETYRRRTMDLALVDASWRPIMVFLIGLSTVIVVWIGGIEVTRGNITIGNIAEYIIYVALMTWPVASLGYVITMVQRASASMSRLCEILDADPEITDSEITDPSVHTVAGAISFERVSFNFSVNGEPALSDITFSIPAGSTLAVVGRTGSGKSTLVELIPRLIDPTSGTVKVDGHDVRTIPIHVLRASIGYVPQEVFLFSDSIFGNIAFGMNEAQIEEVERAALEADLLENVREFPRGFDTLVGERGTTLSGGQKQRTSMARAIIRRPGILILDDALSAVDTSTEASILRHLRAHYGKRTIVLVSHRISAVQGADLILVLEEGRIVERGTHEELLALDGLYADMHRKQLLEEEIREMN